jgi:hypothetical protein
MNKEYCEKRNTTMYDLGNYNQIDWQKLGVKSGDGRNNDAPYAKFWIVQADNHYWCEEKYALPYLELNGRN